MKFIFVLNHPAHYFLFKYIIQCLRNKSHQVSILIKEKDVLEDILINENQDYEKICFRTERKKNIISVVFSSIIELIYQNINLFKYISKLTTKPDFLIGTDISITHIGKFFSIPSFVYNEDDYEINKLFCNFSYPYASAIISPSYTSVGKYFKKKISYDGIQKMAYLNKNFFKPNKSILSELSLKKNQRYFIIRLVSLTAGHDLEGKHNGINKSILKKIIS